MVQTSINLQKPLAIEKDPRFKELLREYKIWSEKSELRTNQTQNIKKNKITLSFFISSISSLEKKRIKIIEVSEIAKSGIKGPVNRSTGTDITLKWKNFIKMLLFII